jgi:hypothetical protein
MSTRATTLRDKAAKMLQQAREAEQAHAEHVEQAEERNHERTVAHWQHVADEQLPALRRESAATRDRFRAAVADRDGAGAVAAYVEHVAASLAARAVQNAAAHALSWTVDLYSGKRMDWRDRSGTVQYPDGLQPSHASNVPSFADMLAEAAENVGQTHAQQTLAGVRAPLLEQLEPVE